MGLTVKVSNISSKASEHDVYDFFSFSGNIISSEIKNSEEDGTQIAFLTFQDDRAFETALLLSGTVIADRAVIVEPAVDYVPDPSAKTFSSTSATAKKAETVVASLLAKGFILGKDAVGKAQAFDQKHDLSRTAAEKAHALRESALNTATSLDQKYAISQKFNQTTEKVTTSLLAVDEQYKVSEKTRFAFTAAESKLNEAGQYMMQNKYVSQSKSWLFGAVGRMSTFVGEVSKQTQDKVHKAEEDRFMGRNAATTLIADDDADEGARNLAKQVDQVGLTDHGPPIAPVSPPSGTSAESSEKTLEKKEDQAPVF